MEMSYSKELLDCMSWFTSTSEGPLECKLIERYNKDLCEIFKLSRPMLEYIFSSGIASNENFNMMLRESSKLADDARKLEKGWHKMTSKFFFVLQMESIISKINTSLQDAVNSFFAASPSLEQSPCTDYVETMQEIPCIRISEIIKDAVQEQMENLIPRSELISKIEDSLSLSSNEELLIEIVALDNLKTRILSEENLGEVEYVDRMIELVNYMHDCHIDKYQVPSINNVPIPADFCCPLSLQVMFDPVIVASGQTYERAFIKQWLEEGFTVCPKTRQVLCHKNLIPNYNVKALIANWCETNKIKLQDPTKSVINKKESKISYPGRLSVNTDNFVASESNAGHVNGNALPFNGHSYETHLPCSHLPKAITVQPICFSDECGFNTDKHLTIEDHDVSSSEKFDGNSGLKISNHSREPPHFSENESARGAQIISRSASIEKVESEHVVSRVSSDLTQYSSDVSGELSNEASSYALNGDHKLASNMGNSRPKSNNLRRRPQDRFGIHISSSSLDLRQDLCGVEAQVRKLVDELKSDNIDKQRIAAIELRHLSKHNIENRIVIANCGAIPQLVRLLRSEDQKTQENAVTALLNLSINDNNKMTIINADVIDPLIHVLETGTAEAKENSAATLFSLSVIEENKARIGRSGAIRLLVKLLGDGTPQGKRDAAIALFNLSILPENKSRIVQAGAVRLLVELMDPAAGMVDMAVAVLSNLSSIPEGRSSIAREGAIPYLVEVVELGSARGKENAAAALFHLCSTSSKFSSMVLQEGCIPPLVALQKFGTPRAKEKAQLLIAHFRSQRHGNQGRS